MGFELGVCCTLGFTYQVLCQIGQARRGSVRTYLLGRQPSRQDSRMADHLRVSALDTCAERAVWGSFDAFGLDDVLDHPWHTCSEFDGGR
jgi:hypothetical protein